MGFKNAKSKTSASSTHKCATYKTNVRSQGVTWRRGRKKGRAVNAVWWEGLANSLKASRNCLRLHKLLRRSLPDKIWLHLLHNSVEYAFIAIHHSSEGNSKHIHGLSSKYMQCSFFPFVVLPILHSVPPTRISQHLIALACELYSFVIASHCSKN